MNHTTLYITTRQLKAAGISLASFPNAGPRCNITGMKKLYWGENAYCIKHGQYVYKVPYQIYNLFATHAY